LKISKHLTQHWLEDNRPDPGDAFEVLVAGQQGTRLDPRSETMAAMNAGNGPVYALNLFDVADRDEYLAYSRRSGREVARHGGKVIAIGSFEEAIAGEVEPRQVLILVEWQSRAHFDAYREDPGLADLHPHREAGGGNYVWHLFDKLDDLRPLLKG
jgi:uncharacterized protein (DUF1330 family)